MKNQISDLQLLSILQFCDSTFPIGAFTLSNGLETQVQKGYLKTAADLKDWCLDYLKLLPYNELGTAVLAWKAADSESQIQKLDAIASCGRGPRELREGSKKLCQRLIRMQERIEPRPHLNKYANLIKEKKAYGSYGVAAGLLISDITAGCNQQEKSPETAPGRLPVTRDLDIREQSADNRDLEACQEKLTYEYPDSFTQNAFRIFCYSLISPMVTNAVKLVPLSQMDGQRVLNELFPAMEEAVYNAFSVEMQDLGLSGAGFDICSMEHEVLYSRVYIS